MKDVFSPIEISWEKKKHKKMHEKIHPSSSTSTDSTQTHSYFLSKKEKKKEKKNKKDVLLDALVYKGIQTIDWLPVCLFLRQCKNSLVREFLATMLQRAALPINSADTSVLFS